MNKHPQIQQKSHTSGTMLRSPRSMKGPAMVFDLDWEMLKLQSEIRELGANRSAKTLVKEPGLAVTMVFLKKGAAIKRHISPGDLAIQTLTGKIRLNLPIDTVELPAGRVLLLERQISHDVVALEDSCFLLTAGLSDHEEHSG